jgi:5-methylcytosine-specific restriction endonuclease McrA
VAVVDWLGDLGATTIEWRYVHGCNNWRSRYIASTQYRRAVKAGVFAEFVDCGVLYRDLGGICGICSQPVDFASFTVDHIVPISRGGPHKRTNLQLAHRACNSSKGAKFPTVK